MAVVQSAGRPDAQSSPFTMTFGADITAGHCIAGFVTTDWGATGVVVADGVNTYSVVGPMTEGYNMVSVWGFYCANVAAGAGLRVLTVTTMNGPNRNGGAALELSGIASVDPLRETSWGIGNRPPVAAPPLGQVGDTVISLLFAGGNGSNKAVVLDGQETRIAFFTGGDLIAIGCATAIRPV